MDVNKLINHIYDNTINVISSKFEDIEAKRYKLYLIKKYSEVLEMIVSEEKNNTLINFIIETYIVDEKKIFENLSKDEILSLIGEDFSFEHLTFLSDIAFEQARKCLQTGIFLDDEEEYMNQINQLADCLDKIEPFNKDNAKELLSEAILDIDFAFKKTQNKSLRLGHLLRNIF